MKSKKRKDYIHARSAFEAAARSAARKIGCPVAEYLRRRARGERWCSHSRHWYQPGLNWRDTGRCPQHASKYARDRYYGLFSWENPPINRKFKP